MAEEPTKNQPQNEGKFWNVLWSYLKSDQSEGDDKNNSNQKSTRSKKKSSKVNFSPSMRQRDPQIFDAAHIIHTVTLALWDNISGPRVEQLWTTADVHRRLVENKQRSDMTGPDMTGPDMTGPDMTGPDIVTTAADTHTSTELSTDAHTEQASVTSDSSDTERHQRLLELIEHVPRYALGGEVWSDGDELTAVTRVTLRPGAAVPSTRPSSRKFAVVRSVKSQHVTHHSTREVTGVTADVTDETAVDNRPVNTLTPVTPPPAPQSTPLRRKIHLFSEIDTAVLSCVFRTHSVNGEGVGTDCALSLFFDSCHLTTFNTWQHVLYDRLQELIHTHVTLISSGALVDTALVILNTDLRAILSYMDELFLASALNRDHVPHISRSLLVDKSIDQDLLARAITSHLQTHGASIVVGSDATQVALWLETLALFTRREDRAKTAVNVSSVTHGSPVTRRYVPDLLLQGIISNDPDQITDEHVIQSMTPATLIDLTRQQVKQTHLFHEYAVLRREWLRAKLDKALLIATNAAQTPKLNNLWHARESLFVQVRVAAPLVVRLLKELFLLPTRHLRAAHLHHYTTWLDKRAMLLIHYVSGLMARQPTMTHLTDPSLIKRIRTDLELLHDVDYSLILARAEMISPGIYVTLTGDPGDIEEKIIRLFESF